MPLRRKSLRTIVPADAGSLYGRGCVERKQPPVLLLGVVLAGMGLVGRALDAQ